MKGSPLVAFLLSANLVWEHYFVLALPLLLAVLKRRFQRATTPQQWITEWILPSVALLGLFATPLLVPPSLPHDVYYPAMQGGGALIRFGLAVGALGAGRGRAEVPADPPNSRPP